MLLPYLVRLVVAHVIDRDVPLDRECPCGLGSGENSSPTTVRAIAAFTPRSVSLSSRLGEPPGQVSETAMSAASPMPSGQTLQRHGRPQLLSSSPQ